MKNLVLITSVIHTSSKPLSYSAIRSVYTPQERFIQTKETIRTVREKIPESKILLVECSYLTAEEEAYFRSHCDYFVNVIDKPGMLEYTTGVSKSLGEGSMFIKAIEYIEQQGLVFDNFFKITGRYFLNEHFKYEKFDNDKICFRYTVGGQSANTCVFKFPFDKVSPFKQFFISVMDEMKQCAQFEVLVLRFILAQPQNTLLEIDRLGITSFVSICGSVIDFY